MSGFSPTSLTFKYHGNYCGPNYGDPEFKQEALDTLDQICKKHDLQYDTEDADLFYADLDFANEALSTDLFSSSYFYLQSALRYLGIMARKNGKKGKKKVSKAATEIKKELQKVERKVRQRKATGKTAGIRVSDSKLGRTKTKITKNQNCHTVSHDFAIDVTITTSKTLGQVITTYALRPDEWDGTRLKQLSGLYEKWRLKRINVEYRPSVATTEPGSFIMFYDPDPTDSAGSTGLTLVQKAASAQNRVRFQCFEPKTLTARPPTGTPPMFTSFQSTDDVRLSSYGNIYVTNDVGLTTSGSKTYGNLYITLDIEFQKPILEELPVSFSYTFSDPTPWNIATSEGLFNYTNLSTKHPSFAMGSNPEINNAQEWITFPEGYDFGGGEYGTVVVFNRPGWYMVRVAATFTTLGATDFTVYPTLVDLFDEYDTVYQSSNGTCMWSAIVNVTGRPAYVRSQNNWSFTGNGSPYLGIFLATAATNPAVNSASISITPLPGLNAPLFARKREGKKEESTLTRLLELEKKFANLALEYKKEDLKKSVDTCFFCGKSDHLPKHCFKNPNRVN
jgi:hypothetical protein